MPPAETAPTAGLLAVAGLAAGLVVALSLQPTLAWRAVTRALPASALQARGAGLGAGDLGATLALLDRDAEVRAAEALYAAALEAPLQSGRRLAALAPGARPGSLEWSQRAVDALFEATREAPVRDGSSALSQAARATGVDMTYLYRTARAESGFNPYARATTSSARGLFQFIEQTWLAAVAKWGARHGRAAEAKLVRLDRTGRAYVADPGQARAILALRYDPELSALLAAELARENAAVIQIALRRAVTSRELYAAHLLGPRDAIRLIQAAEAVPDMAASDLLPEAAAQNRGLFFEAGEPRTVADLLVRLP